MFDLVLVLRSLGAAFERFCFCPGSRVLFLADRDARKIVVMKQRGVVFEFL
ncbi:hypothetical protein D3C83_216690 [compost metagenome]